MDANSEQARVIGALVGVPAEDVAKFAELRHGKVFEESHNGYVFFMTPRKPADGPLYYLEFCEPAARMRTVAWLEIAFNGKIHLTSSAMRFKEMLPISHLAAVLRHRVDFPHHRQRRYLGPLCVALERAVHQLEIEELGSSRVSV